MNINEKHRADGLKSVVAKAVLKQTHRHTHIYIKTVFSLIIDIRGHGHPELLLKIPPKWCILKDVLTYSLGFIEERNA